STRAISLGSMPVCRTSPFGMVTLRVRSSCACFGRRSTDIAGLPYFADVARDVPITLARRAKEERSDLTEGTDAHVLGLEIVIELVEVLMCRVELAHRIDQRLNAPRKLWPHRPAHR